jgi:ABC-2 type transport system permease protein
MSKILSIGLKDLTIAFRDRAALILMLAAPFVLTLGMGFVSGRFSSDSGGGGLSGIPVVVVNEDDGPLGEALIELLASEGLADLVAPVTAADAGSARALVDVNDDPDNAPAAAVIIPAGFTDSIIAAGPAVVSADPVEIEVYTNPARPLGSSVVVTIVEAFIDRVETARVSGIVTIEHLIATGRLAVEEAAALARALGGQGDPGEGAITVEPVTTTGTVQEFDVLAYFAPGMAMLFLMYTVSHGARTLLTERDQGTLARLLVSPTALAQILGGKVLGIFFTGAAQVGVLVAATTLLFGLRWGDPLGVAALVLAVAAAATGWGLLLAALARNAAQVGSLGAALMLLFGILSGTFINVGTSGGLNVAARLTPNAWGLEGFTTLARGGTLAEVALPIGALVLMAAVLFGAALAVMPRQNLARG